MHGYVLWCWMEMLEYYFIPGQSYLPTHIFWESHPKSIKITFPFEIDLIINTPFIKERVIIYGILI
jgi:hypothetical protein